MKNITFLLLAIFFTQCSAQQPEWERLFFSDAMGTPHMTSSELDAVDPFEGLGNYGGHNLFDKSKYTAWVEGVEGPGTGEYFYLAIGEILPEQMVIHNGFQKTDDLFTKNNRVKTIRVSLFAGFMIPGDVTEIGVYYYLRQFGAGQVIGLEDRSGTQEIDLPFEQTRVNEFAEMSRKQFMEEHKAELEKVKEDCPTEPSFRFFVRIEILDVYKGSQWDDTCISDVWFTSPKETIDAIPPDERITEVWEDMEEAMIYVNTNKRSGIVLADGNALEEARNLEADEHMDITLMDVSPDKEWAQIDYLYTQDGAGRVEEYSTLYSVRYLCMIDDPIVGIIYGAFGFTEKDGKIFLDTADGPLDLEKVLEDFLESRKNK
jgi:hypothetical protein